MTTDDAFHWEEEEDKPLETGPQPFNVSLQLYNMLRELTSMAKRREKPVVLLDPVTFQELRDGHVYPQGLKLPADQRPDYFELAGIRYEKGG